MLTSGLCRAVCVEQLHAEIAPAELRDPIWQEKNLHQQIGGYDLLVAKYIRLRWARHVLPTLKTVYRDRVHSGSMSFAVELTGCRNVLMDICTL